MADNDYVFNIHSWPRAIVHVDGDAFFTSCEEAIHPELRGKPLVTGGERGIVACASYAAKRLGVKRGVPLREARKICPGLIVLPSDYETYSLFSQRMFAIMRRFTPQVEEYSIDEAFADITGLRRVLNGSYEGIALAIKKAVARELGVTVSVGLSVTKVLAKVASKHRKPDGFTAISGREIPRYLDSLPAGSIWGVGHATSNHLLKLGVKTALEFARLPQWRVSRLFAKSIREIWSELRGESVFPVAAEKKSAYASISKTKTFAPPTNDRDYLFAQVMRNCESACIKARRHSLASRRIALFLKKNDFTSGGVEATLSRATAYPLELSGLMRRLFDGLWGPGIPYRATGVVLLDLVDDGDIQYSLFDNPLSVEKTERLYDAADRLAGKYGKHALHLGCSHFIETLGKGRRGEATTRERTILRGETRRKHLGLPIFHVPPRQIDAFPCKKTSLPFIRTCTRRRGAPHKPSDRSKQPWAKATGISASGKCTPTSGSSSPRRSA